MFDPLPIAAYSFVMSITPGPNNVMLTASGATFGFRRTVPHLLGISSGHLVQVFAVAIGLGAIFARWPMLHGVLGWAGAIYLVYLGYRLLFAGAVGDASAAKPLTFLQAALFQFVNPKAWIMGFTATALFLPADASVLVGGFYMAGLMAVVNLPCVGVWALFGSSLRQFLSRPSRRVVFNGFMALALAGTGLMMVL